MELGIGGLGHGTVIGAGASATVYRATQTDLDREVAVKVLNATDDAFVRRFRQEAKLLGKLSLHSGIVTVYDSGVNQSGQPYLILELCEDSLLDHLHRDGPFDPIAACQILVEVTEAVGLAHADGVIHRDIKPANLLRTSDDAVLITDFGIATVTATATSITGLTEPAGSQERNGGLTAGYAAPEVIEGGAVGTPADVYGIGATLFHLMVGQAPFVGSDQEDPNLLVVVQRIVNDPIGNLRPPDVPDVVWEIIDKAMAKDPLVRPTVAELARLLRSAADALIAEGPDPVDAGPVKAEIAPPTLPSKPGTTEAAMAGASITGTQTVGVSTETAWKPPVLYAVAAGLAGIVLTVSLLLLISGDDNTSNKVAAGEGEQSESTSPFVAELGREQALAGPGIGSGSQQSGSYDLVGPPELRPNLDSAAKRITVPSVSGETQASAQALLAAAGLRVNVVYEETSSVAVGLVISQDPANGEVVFEETLITIFVSREVDVPPVSVPAVAGLSAADATAAVKAKKLTVSKTRAIYHDTVPAGVAVGTDPSAKTLVNANSSVTLFVSLGRPVVPEMSGVTAEQAIAKLAELTLVAEVVSGPGTSPLGTVQNTTPGHGAAVDTNSTVQVLVVNSVIPPDCTMDVATLVHHAKAAAEAMIVAAGCQLGPDLPSEHHDHVAAGNVVRGVLSGPQVTLVISNGPMPAPVCDLAALTTVVAGLPGKTREAAVAAISQTNCTVGADLPAEASETIPAGLVLRGDVVGEVVRLVLVETAPATCVVPPVIGLTVADAKLAIGAAGCIGIIDHSGALSAVVTGTAPAAGTVIPIADVIALAVTLPELVTVPIVVGMTEDQAKATLASGGLVGATAGTVPLPPGDAAIGLVVAQIPAAGQLDAGSTVNLDVGVAAPPDTLPPSSTVPVPSPVSLSRHPSGL